MDAYNAPSLPQSTISNRSSAIPMTLFSPAKFITVTASYTAHGVAHRIHLIGTLRNCAQSALRLARAGGCPCHRGDLKFSALNTEH